MLLSSCPVLPDLPVIQEEPEKSQISNAGNYFKFLKKQTNTHPEKPTVCANETHSAYHLPAATSAWASYL